MKITLVLFFIIGCSSINDRIKSKRQKRITASKRGPKGCNLGSKPSNPYFSGRGKYHALSAGKPDGPGRGGEIQEIRYKTYAVGYDLDYLIPQWTQTRLTNVNHNCGKTKRKSFWCEEEIPEYSITVESDYRNCRKTEGRSPDCWALGHLQPYTSVGCRSDRRAETMSMANVAPQWGRFNAHVWEEIEACVKEWQGKKSKRKGKLRKDITVITGVIPSEEIMGEIFPNFPDITLPSHFYKIVYDHKTKDAIAFAMKNERSAGGLNDYYLDIRENYAVSIVPINQLEEITGFNFLTNVKGQIKELNFGDPERMFDDLKQKWDCSLFKDKFRR